MWQLSEAIDGMAEACRDLGLPVIGGNVSLYNEIGRRRHRPDAGRRRARADRRSRRGGRPASASSTAACCCNSAPPRAPAPWPAPAGPRPCAAIGAARCRRSTWPPTSPCCDLVRGLVVDGLVDGVHDVADGGLGVTLAEMAVQPGVGFDVGGIDGGHADLFAEAPSRAVVCVAGADVAEVERRAVPRPRRRRSSASGRPAATAWSSTGWSTWPWPTPWPPSPAPSRPSFSCSIPDVHRPFARHRGHRRRWATDERSREFVGRSRRRQLRRRHARPGRPGRRRGRVRRAVPPPLPLRAPGVRPPAGRPRSKRTR